ncbi:MAG: GNAT family N-acetyltransferase [Alphaproteobacteria bacterium]|nr:GNAT family N-acetyltransferase [Alphaproteobacteria bacterium]
MIGASREVSPMEIRWSKPADTAALAALHRDAWRYAYRGIIPGVSLERIIARRGPAWWERMHESGPRALVLEFDKRVVGYATFGSCRTRGLAQRGEIHELYLRPEFHGTGFGKRLFAEARRHLSARGLLGLLVWALADNNLACRFYRALGGRERTRAYERIGGVRLEMIAFVWR